LFEDLHEHIIRTNIFFYLKLTVFTSFLFIVAAAFQPKLGSSYPDNTFLNIVWIKQHQQMHLSTFWE